MGEENSIQVQKVLIMNMRSGISVHFMYFAWRLHTKGSRALGRQAEGRKEGRQAGKQEERKAAEQTAKPCTHNLLVRGGSSFLKSRAGGDSHGSLINNLGHFSGAVELQRGSMVARERDNSQPKSKQLRLTIFRAILLVVHFT